MEISPLPDSILNQLKKCCPDENIQVAVTSDLTQQLVYGEEWLVATDKKLATFSAENGSAKLLSLHNLSDIHHVEAINLTGSGVIEIKSNERSHRLINFTNAKNADFAWAVEDIKTLLDGNTIERKKADRQKKICEHCGFPLPEDLNKCPRCTEKWKTLRRILDFIQPYKAQLLFIFLLLVAGTCFGLITPYISKLFIDVILKPDPKTGLFEHAHWIPLAALALFAAYAGQNLFSSLHLRLTGTVGHKTVYDVRAAIYEKLQELSLAFFDKYQTGALMARVNQDTRELQHFLVDFIPLTLESLFTLIAVSMECRSLCNRLTFHTEWIG